MKIQVRLSNERGHADHGWLKTYHTWSFASYYDSRFASGFGCLRVLNEDRVQPTKGFGKHPHSEYEIFSYVVDGELEHQDSMGNTEVIHRGEVQFTSAGTGIQHSEFNRNKFLWVHFIQIWVKPSQTRLKPSYTTKQWSDDDKTNTFCLIVDDIHSQNTSAIPIHAPISMYATILQPQKTVKHEFKRSKGYIHLIMRNVDEQKNPLKPAVQLKPDIVMYEGDGAFIECDSLSREIAIENVGLTNVEILLFDLE